jgi:hypothetical protein
MLPKQLFPRMYTDDKFTASQERQEHLAKRWLSLGDNHNLGNEYGSQESSEQNKW